MTHTPLTRGMHRLAPSSLADLSFNGEISDDGLHALVDVLGNAAVLPRLVKLEFVLQGLESKCTTDGLIALDSISHHRPALCVVTDRRYVGHARSKRGGGGGTLGSRVGSHLQAESVQRNVSDHGNLRQASVRSSVRSSVRWLGSSRQASVSSLGSTRQASVRSLGSTRQASAGSLLGVFSRRRASSTRSGAEEGGSGTAGILLTDELHRPPQRQVEQRLLDQRMKCTNSGQSKTRADWWDHWYGGLIEPTVRSGAVALLDGAWLLNLAQTPGARIQPRQSLPYEAFVSIDELKAVTDGEYRLPIIALSYVWLTPHHPDPLGFTLGLVGQVLPLFLRKLKRVGIFWDFASLLQPPNPTAGVMRSPAEDGLFRQGLGSLADLYAHQYTYVLRFTKLPENYPLGYALPEGSPVAAYADRGWPFVETCWASMTKSNVRLLDLGGMSGTQTTFKGLLNECKARNGRPPPLTPSAFASLVADKQFTNGSTDHPLTIALYEASFAKHFGLARELAYHENRWTDDDAKLVAAVLASGACTSLVSIFMRNNRIGDAGAKALALALSREALPSLQRVNLQGNRELGEEGVAALHAAMEGMSGADGAPTLMVEGAGTGAWKALVRG